MILRYLSAADILAIHDRLIEEIGGLPGVRDTNLLQSIPKRPQASFGGTEQFPSLHEKSAVYLESLATYHVFLDGNKRTALSVASVFLMLNGYTVSFPIAETEAFIIAAAEGKYSLQEIALWLKRHSRKRRAH